MKKYMAIAGAGLMLVGTAGLAAAATVDVGGEIRVKYENRENIGFDNDLSGKHESGTHQRTRLNINAKVNDEVSGYIQLQNIRTWGGTDTLNNSTATDVHQAYIQVNKVFGTPLSVRLGRQELSYGSQRLIGALDWADTARAFDAAKFMYKSNDLDVDFWASKTDENSWATTIVGTGTNLAGTDADQDFYGVWATYKGIKDNTIDAYALWLRDGATSGTSLNGISYDGAGTNREGAVNLYTLGARLTGKVSSVDYSAELMYQTGNDLDDRDINAMAYAVQVGYTVPVDLAPRLYVEYVHADGDENSSDQDVETFNQLFPTGHMHLGYADLVGFQNIDAWRFGVSIKPTKALYVQLDYWNFKLAEEKDYWYRANGSAVNSTATIANNSEDDLGGEIDLTAKYKYSDNLSLEGGYSLFLAGDIQERSLANGGAGFGEDDDLQWFYAQVKLTF